MNNNHHVQERLQNPIVIPNDDSPRDSSNSNLEVRDFRDPTAAGHQPARVRSQRILQNDTAEHSASLPEDTNVNERMNSLFQAEIFSSTIGLLPRTVQVSRKPSDETQRSKIAQSRPMNDESPSSTSIQEQNDLNSSKNDSSTIAANHPLNAVGGDFALNRLFQSLYVIRATIMVPITLPMIQTTEHPV